jgi:hypothetical protein
MTEMNEMLLVGDIKCVIVFAFVSYIRYKMGMIK